MQSAMQTSADPPALDAYADLFDDDLDGVATALDRAAMQSDGAKLLAQAA